MFTPSSLRLTTTRTCHHLRRTPFLASIRHPTALHQPFHNAARLAYPRKGSEDKDSINRESMEYTKTGSDDQVAAMGDAAFNPDKTSPEEEMKTAGEGNGVSGFVFLMALRGEGGVVVREGRGGGWCFPGFRRVGWTVGGRGFAPWRGCSRVL